MGREEAAAVVDSAVLEVGGEKEKRRIHILFGCKSFCSCFFFLIN